MKKSSIYLSSTSPDPARIGVCMLFANRPRPPQGRHCNVGVVVQCGVRRCEAEPAVLAKYVLALLRNDKPEPELRALCEEQLEDFLGEWSRHRSVVRSNFSRFSL